MGKIEDSRSKQQCCVPQCKSRPTNEISLFRFPKEESQRKKWADAIKIEKGITPQMQVCSRHFVKNDYIMADGPNGKVKRLKKSALPSQNLPWQFPNKHVSPTLAKARMERLKNRSLHKTSDSPVKSESPAKKSDGAKKSESTKKPDGKKSEPKSKTSSEKSEEPKDDNENTDNDEKKSTGDSSVDVKSEKGDEIDENNEEAVEENGETIEAKKDENVKGRAPTRLRQQTGILKCEHCGRKCLTPQALQTHQQIAHKHIRISHINKNTPINKPKPSPKPSVPVITVRDPLTLQKPNILKPKVTKSVEKPLNSSEVEKVLQEDSDFTGTASDSDLSVKEDKAGKPQQRKTEFECPICKRRFAVFFMANKHIQKYHSGPQNGSNTPILLPKPNRIELCTICNSTVESAVHICSGPLKLAMGFVCTGCGQEYKTLTMFDMHKSSRHNDGVESMFFPTLDEFEAWKQKMEQQTLASYSIMDHNDTKQIHRCAHRTRLGAGSYSRQRLCPSSVVVQEFTKGFQVHYYPNHYDHPHEKYTLGKAFKKYSISSLMNLTASTLPDSEDDDPPETDLYLQFKKITNVLVTEAARINVNGLKKLMRKALDMIAIVNSYVEDEDDDMITSSVIKLDPDNDDLQEQVKKALKSLKRPSEIIEATPIKRRKSVFQSTENLKSKDVVAPVKEETKNAFEKKPPLKNQSASFIDSFQDFVGKTLEKTVEKKKRQSDGKKTPTVKTKMGQFKPKTPPKKALSPKSSKPKTPKPSPKSATVKDIEYEVKEQENDCNILILKI